MFLSWRRHQPKWQSAPRRFEEDLRTVKGRRMAAGRGCFAPESRSLTTIHLNRASNIAGVRVRCTIHRRNKEALPTLELMQHSSASFRPLEGAFLFVASWRVQWYYYVAFGETPSSLKKTRQNLCLFTTIVSLLISD